MMSLEKLFEVYPDAFLQDMRTALIEMGKAGISVESFLEYSKQRFSEKRNWQYEDLKRRQLLRKEFFFKTRRCALCGNPMNLFTVNDTPCTQVGGKHQSMWQCADVMGCGETAYSNLPIHLEAEKFGLGKFFASPEEIVERRNRRSRRAAQQAASGRRVCSGNK